MSETKNAVKEAIQTFMNIKEKVIDKLMDKDVKKAEKVGAKLRSRAREIPEMILELGLVPTISYCLSKANVDNVVKVIKVIEMSDSVQLKELLEIKEEELAYALYTYALLNYLSIIAGKVGDSELKLEELAEKNRDRVYNVLIRYLEALMESEVKSLIHKLLQLYLLQFKRLCEATYKSER